MQLHVPDGSPAEWTGGDHWVEACHLTQAGLAEDMFTREASVRLVVDIQTHGACGDPPAVSLPAQRGPSSEYRPAALMS